MRCAFLFLDGVGIGLPDPEVNPFLRAELPFFTEALNGLPTLADAHVSGPSLRAFPIDATLDTPGIPQSGTGQTSLLTGDNAAVRFGRHFGPWVPTALRPFLEEANVLARAQQRGHSVAFANAYPPDFLKRYPRRIAAPPLVATSAGLMTRHADALREGRAVASEIMNHGWKNRLGHVDLPDVSPEEAGRNLAGIVLDHDLTFFAHYSTDQAGHRGGVEGAVHALERVDGFLAGMFEALPDDVLVLVASDHGNIEDVREGHTRNPALGLLRGGGDELPADLTRVAPFLLAALDD